MKKTIRIMIAVLAIAAMLFSFVACGGKTNDTKPTDSANPTDTANTGSLMQELLDTVKNGDSYNEWKAAFTATTFEEKLEGDSIIFSFKGEEGINGDYAFTQDGDYIVNTSDEGDYTAYTLMMDLKDALAKHYGASNMLWSGYLAATANSDLENKYYITETADGKTESKLYAAEAWDMSGLDDIYVDEKTLENYDTLNEPSFNLHVNCGKIMLTTFKSDDQLTMIVGEYGENTELTRKSVLSLVNKAQPKGYEAFAADFTEVKAIESEDYTVTLGVPEEIAAEHSYPNEEGYSYITVVFGRTAEETAE